MCSPYPKVACAATVESIQPVGTDVFSLVLVRQFTPVSTCGDRGIIPEPIPGQFFMLRARPSGVLLGRPISVYCYDDRTITFLILKKGKGTSELCSVSPGQQVDIIGPIGNCFLRPDSSEIEEVIKTAITPRTEESAELSVAVIGGGIGVAPVAGFALSLPPGTFDFYASFRTGTYGLDGIAAIAKNVIITTEDGSFGDRGMLSDVFNPELYDLVYACGPTPMLKYIQSACKNASRHPLVYLSLEQHMACGAGACLGCTIQTMHGNKRCCVDGPVFNAAEVIL